MPLHSHLIRLTFLVALAPVASTATAADPPPPKQAPQTADDIKPLPPVAIPDDPPPHEGALFDFPLTIEPPDIIIVEVLETLPGRPITGERLVRPDGTISLGFYGDVNVRGLTTQQAKVKVIHQLRKQMVDVVLGLAIPVGPPMPPLGPPGSPVPESEFQRQFDQGGEVPPGSPYEPISPGGPVPPRTPNFPSEPGADRPPAATGKPSAELPKREGSVRRISRSAQDPKPSTVEKQVGPGEKGAKPPIPGDPFPPEVMEGPLLHGPFVYIDPVDCPRVFVDIVAHNHLVYYVQGDVGQPARLPFTGKETVLDALNYAGGFLPTAEPTDIHLYRPALGGKAAKDYKIDIDAIYKGNAKVNLQIFPGDRLIVGRNPIVKKTIEVDRANGLINSALNTMLQYSLTVRSMAAPNTTPSNAAQIKVNGQNLALDAANGPAITPAQRDAMIRDWVDFLWSVSSKEGGAMLDEKAFRAALLKKLGTTAEPKK